jgi:D-alanyl-lipoteichoic acid acyltransferase DltB (MBOAT superfamily)
MIFSSYQFLIFLAGVVAVWLVLERHGLLGLRKLFLIAVSLAFYAWWRVDGLALLLGSIGVNLAIGRHLHKTGANKPLWCAIGVALNLGLLGVFKYLGLFEATTHELFGVDLELPSLFRPLGISFFTFQQISWIVDSARGKAPRYGVTDYLLFICFFPHLIAGPIVLHNELIPQFGHRRGAEERWHDVAGGVTLFTIGLFKKVLLANSIEPYPGLVFSAAGDGAAIGTFDAWMGAGLFALQIYLDFSAYTDMALGAALMLGIRLPLNFNSPYKATSVIDFWHRWHISLSNFLREYLYIPLGGNRRGRPRRYLTRMQTMLICGLWHGGSWNFAVWGGLHGLYLCINHLWRHVSAPWRPALPAPLRRLGAPLSVAVTLLATTFAWVFFRAQGFDAAIAMVRGMLGVGGSSMLLAGREDAVALLVVLTGVVLFAPNSMEMLRHVRPALNMPADAPPPRWLAWRPTPAAATLCAITFVVSILAIWNLRPFIYFEF